MEYERVQSNDRNRIITHLAGITLLVATLAVYRCTNPQVDPDEAYPKAACFKGLDPVNQKYFLDNREFIIKHPDAYSPSTEDVLLHVDCPVEDIEVNVLPDNSVLSSTTP